MVSADAYPSRPSVDRDSGGGFEAFMANNVNPIYATASADDEPAPDRDTVQQSDLMASGKPDPNGEVLGGMYHPSTTIAHGNPSEPGMPAGTVAAKIPAAQ